MSQGLAIHRHRVAFRSDRIGANHDVEAAQIVHLPAVAAAELRGFADDLERSEGWCLWMAWCLATVEIGHDELERLCEESVPGGDRVAVRAVMPLGTWRHLTRAAEELDRSKSWLLARAWARSRAHFAR